MTGGNLDAYGRRCARAMVLALVGGALATPTVWSSEPIDDQAVAAAASTTPDAAASGVAATSEKSIVVATDQTDVTPTDAAADDAADDGPLEPIAATSDLVPDLADPVSGADDAEPTLADDPEATAGYAPATPGGDDLPVSEDVCIDEGDYAAGAPHAAATEASLEPASFHGVVPGETTRVQVLRQWGDPAAKAPGGGDMTFAFDDFPSVGVAFDGDLVESIRVELFEPASTAKLVDRLGLATVRPAVQRDQEGVLKSTTFPERGVTFNHQPALAGATATDGHSLDEATDEDQVNEIVISTIDAAAFVARADADEPYAFARQIADLETALRLDPTLAAARASLARLKLATGQAAAAQELASSAVDLEPRNDEHRLIWAKCLKCLARYDQAVLQTRQVLESERASQLVRAQALDLLGQLAALGAGETRARAIPLHTKAIELADKLVSDADGAVAGAANQLLIDAHLAVAEQIAAGAWQDKDQAVADWIERSSGLAEDLISRGEADVSLRLRVAVSALNSGARLTPPIDPALWIAEAEEAATALEQEITDKAARDAIRWQLGLAYLYGTEIQHRRTRATEALKYGALAESSLAPLADVRGDLPDTQYVLARLRFQIGAVHAVHGQDHEVACQWYDRAVEGLTKPAPVTELAGPKQHGESLVSMGVSYWQVGQKERAYELTRMGAELIEQAVESKLLAAEDLDVPRHNLEAMNRALGKTPLAASAVRTTPKTQVAAAPKPGTSAKKAGPQQRSGRTRMATRTTGGNDVRRR